MGVSFCHSQLWAIAEELVRQTAWLADVISLPGFGPLSPGRSFPHPFGALWGSWLRQTPHPSVPDSMAAGLVCCLSHPDHHTGNFPACSTESDAPPGRRASPGPCSPVSSRELDSLRPQHQAMGSWWSPPTCDTQNAAVGCCKHIQDRGRKSPWDML